MTVSALRGGEDDRDGRSKCHRHDMIGSMNVVLNTETRIGTIDEAAADAEQAGAEAGRNATQSKHTNMSAVLMESSVCRNIRRGGSLAALLKGIRSIRAEFCNAQQTTCCSDASIRSAALPDIRTTGKFVRSYEASRWYGVAVPRNTPLEVVDKLNRETNLLIEAFKRA